MKSYETHKPVTNKILVTGGSGLVGTGIESALCSNFKLLKAVEGDFVFASSADADLKSYSDTAALFERVKPTYVIHLAAIVGGLYKNMNYKVEMFEDNMDINNNVLKCCHRFNVKKVISCLSTCIFPDKVSYPINEDMLHDGAPHTSNDAYAYAKRMVEVLSNAYNTQYPDGTQFVCVVPTNIYGPNDNFNLENGHVLPALIHRCYLAKESGEPFVVRGTGKPLRQFIHAKDVGTLILLLLFDKNITRGSFILSPDEQEEVCIGDLAKIIAEKFGHADLVFDGSFADGQFKKTADNSKLRILGETYKNYQFIGIEQGIADAVEWFRENFESARK